MRLTLLTIRPEGDNIPTVFSLVFGMHFADVANMTPEEVYPSKGGPITADQFRRNLLIGARDAITETLARLDGAELTGAEPQIGGKRGKANHTKAQGNT